MARSLGAEGLEMYEGFFTSLDDAYIDSVGEAIAATGCAMPMLCCSPDFTNPDADARKRALDHEVEMIRVTRRLGGPRAACRVLSGQRYPEVPRAQGVAWVVEAIERCCPSPANMMSCWRWRITTRTATGAGRSLRRRWMSSWRSSTPSTTAPTLACSTTRPTPSSPATTLSNCWSGSRRRVVTMHASDRYLEPGATLDELRQTDGTIGYFAKLKHGVTGKGLNDYDRIFAILKSVNYQGWISIEDGMNGMEEMKESIDFLKLMRDRYFA
jgi:sugar phosphate isomerase/epimerase